MAKFREYEQKQGVFRSIFPEELLEDEHPAKVIDKVVEKLDLSDVYAYYGDVGNEAYHPKMQLKILFYSYFNGTLSCRKIWKCLDGRADYIFLSGNNLPNFRTINNFRLKHINEMPDIFAQIVMLCEELGMIGFEHMALDGQKIQANASFRKSINEKRLKTRYEKIKNGIEKLVKQEPDDDLPADTIQKRIAKLKRDEMKLDNLAEKLKRLKEEGIDGNVNMTDEDAPIMKHKNGRSIPSYNNQSAVDKKYGVTVAVETTVHNDSAADLLPIVDEAKNNTGKSFKEVSADSGFCDFDVLQKVEEERVEDFYMPDNFFESSQKNNTEKMKYDSSRFKRESNGGLTCPKGHNMKIKTVNKFDEHHVTVYEGTACGSCTVREKCTKGKKRTVSVDSREPYRDIMREKLKTTKGRETYRIRQWLVEAPHGHDQKNLGWTQHHLRSLQKASLEFMLIRIGANLGKICRYRSPAILAME